MFSLLMPSGPPRSCFSLHVRRRWWALRCDCPLRGTHTPRWVQRQTHARPSNMMIQTSPCLLSPSALSRTLLAPLRRQGPWKGEVPGLAAAYFATASTRQLYREWCPQGSPTGVRLHTDVQTWARHLVPTGITRRSLPTEGGQEIHLQRYHATTHGSAAADTAAYVARRPGGSGRCHPKMGGGGPICDEGEDETKRPQRDTRK